MMRRAKTGFLFVLTMGLLVVSVGCPDSTVLETGSGSATISVFNNGLGKWDGGASLSLFRISFRPLDENADDLLGRGSILLTTESPFVSGTEPQVDQGFFSPIALPPGSYWINELILTDLFFSKLNIDPDSTECEQIFEQDFNPINMNFSRDNPELVFTVFENTDTIVALTFDMEALAEALESALDPAASYVPPDPPYCIGAMDGDIVAAALGTFLTID